MAEHKWKTGGYFTPFLCTPNTANLCPWRELLSLTRLSARRRVFSTIWMLFSKDRRFHCPIITIMTGLLECWWNALIRLAQVFFQREMNLCISTILIPSQSTECMGWMDRQLQVFFDLPIDSYIIRINESTFIHQFVDISHGKLNTTYDPIIFLGVPNGSEKKKEKQLMLHLLSSNWCCCCCSSSSFFLLSFSFWSRHDFLMVLDDCLMIQWWFWFMAPWKVPPRKGRWMAEAGKWYWKSKMRYDNE